MADLKESSQATSLTLNAHQTALCFIPPDPLVEDANRLRALYDQAFEKWPAHVNLIYPFVSFDRLPAAVDLIRSNLSSWLSEVVDTRFQLRLNKPGHFSQRHGNIVYLAPDDGEGFLNLNDFRNAILEGFKQPANEQNRGYQPHLTIGQSKANDDNARDYLLSKAELLPPVEWEVGQLAIMIREKTANSNKMKLWGTIDLDETAKFNQIAATPQDTEQCEEGKKISPTSPTNLELSLQDLSLSSEHGGSGAESRVTYKFWEDVGIWAPAEASSTPDDEEQIPSTFKVSSYNVLVDSVHPPATDRYPTLLQTLISKASAADVLVLQEVSDDFLAYILGHEVIQTIYPFATHGPPGQNGIGPLPSLRNIVALSRSNFTWSWLPFSTNHKGAVILSLTGIGKMEEAGFAPSIIAGVHLSSGLFDYAVAARKQQLQRLSDFLSTNYASNPKVIAGDFNMTTSTITHEEAAEKKSISPRSIATLPVLESMLQSVGYSDSWFIAHTGMGDMVSPSRLERDFTLLYDGEQGATFDPLENPLAATSSDSTANPRPHRYDRILFGKGDLKVTTFNMFGFPIKGIDETTGNTEMQFPSDHWGIRASLEFDLNGGADGDSIARSAAPLNVKLAHPDFDDPARLKVCLADKSIVPPPEDAEKRKAAFSLLKHLIQHGSLPEPGKCQNTTRSKFSIVVTSVGSYGLGVWTDSSDVDCLCVGSISSKVFFELAIQRLRKGADSGVKILRKVKAATGTMLELEISGVKFDLQYCPAAAVAERWLEVPQLPRSNPLFDLALLPLMKLQPYRDQAYLQRTIQNPATFRLLHRIIKAWAKHRGIYSSKFGYLGGIHITMMLSRLLKLLPPNPGSAADILCTFFNHYGNFNWKEDVAYDPIFHKKPPRYHRTPREGMVILTLHTPVMNVARSSSIPAMKTIVDEMKRAENLISEGNASWTELVEIEPKTGKSALSSFADEFLKSYNSYIKINVQYWDLSLAKGSSLVGWLESRCLVLLADLHRKFPDIQTRIWPARFARSEDNDNSTPAQEECEYQGCYLIGLTKADDITDPTRTLSKPDRKLAQDALQASIDQFKSHIHSDAKYFDSASAWVDVSHVKQDNLGPLKLDDRDWGDYIIQDNNFDDFDSEDGDSDLYVEDDDVEAATESDPISSTNKKTAHKSTNKLVSTPKLRPASDILSRLRWDPSLHSTEYIVGYEDRFLGAMEIPLDRWKSEQTDEEFIPQHRILYFKQKTDGRVVWDREARRDEIFGSGVGKGGE